MKNISLILTSVMSLLLVLAVPAMAIPVWSTNIGINTDTDRLHNDVNGGFNSGTFGYTVDTTTSSHTVNANMNVDSGSLAVDSNGKDTTTWHNGQTGETNGFQGVGGWSGTYKTSSNGNYGILNSYVNMASKSGGADFQMSDTQNFNVMSGNHINNVVGNFYAHASGTNDQVAMNMKSVGSMYVWSEATDPYSSAPLRGSVIEKAVGTTKNDVTKTDLYLGVNTNGVATMSNSNIWGWSNGETGTSSTNYGGGTRSVSATGAGSFEQDGLGQNSLNFNGFSFTSGGTASFTGSFSNGWSGTYSMDAS